jgi:hypothetical protein
MTRSLPTGAPAATRSINSPPSPSARLAVADGAEQESCIDACRAVGERAATMRY